jgi:anti-anti-sigma factor
MFDTDGFAAPVATGATAFACSWSHGGEDAACVHLTGELDLSTAPELERTLQEAQARAPVVVLDLRELTFIDSSGLHVIIKANARATQADRRFIIVRGARQFDRLLTVTGVGQRLEIVDLDPADPAADAIRRLAAPTPAPRAHPGTNMSTGAAAPNRA